MNINMNYYFQSAIEMFESKLFVSVPVRLVSVPVRLVSVAVRLVSVPVRLVSVSQKKLC